MIKAFVLWTVAKTLGLASGIFSGAVMAITIVAGGPSVLLDLAKGEVGFVTAIEWNIALQFACYIALAGTILWTLIAWRRLASLMSAAILGFCLSSMMSSVLFFGDNAEGPVFAKIAACALLGGAGAVAGLITFYVDHVAARAFRNARVGWFSGNGYD